MLFFISSVFTFALAGDVCSEIDCSFMNDEIAFSMEEANERWNMKPRQTRAGTYRYITSLQNVDKILEDSTWTALYWQKFLTSQDIRERMASLELIHRSHQSKIRKGESSQFISENDIYSEITKLFKSDLDRSYLEISLMGLIECSQILSVSDQISLHNRLTTFHQTYDLSTMSAHALRELDPNRLDIQQTLDLQQILSTLLSISNKPSEIIRALDWLKLYDENTQIHISRILKDSVTTDMIDTELFLRGVRYFEHANISEAILLINSYNLSRSKDVRLQRLADKITDTTK